MSEDLAADLGPDRTLLLVDDDEPFVKRLAKAMEKRGFLPETAQSVAEGRAKAIARPPAYAVVDLRLEDGNGLEVIETLHEKRPSCRVVVLTGRRDGQPYRVEIDLPLLFSAGGRDKDVIVQNGDTVWVDRQPIVYIYGEVQRPGAMRLERDMTVLQALAAGGGLNARGTQKGLRVHRKGRDGAVEILEPTMTDKLREGDVVFVRESLF